MKTLKNVMLINALTSGATGLILVLFPSFVADMFGYPQSLPFTAVGAFLVLFAVLVFVQSRKNPMNKNGVKFIITLDGLWVVESVAIIVSQMFNFTSTGYLIIGVVAAWVALMAFLQTKGLKAFSMVVTKKDN